MSPSSDPLPGDPRPTFEASLTDTEFLRYESRWHGSNGATDAWSSRFVAIADRLAALETLAEAARALASIEKLGFVSSTFDPDPRPLMDALRAALAGLPEGEQP